jgi:cation diffusion facilitator CzcD-associated flavoprotein CzcO
MVLVRTLHPRAPQRRPHGAVVRIMAHRRAAGQPLTGSPEVLRSRSYMAVTSVEHYDVLIVGSGFAGVGMAIELRRRGTEDLVVLEQADRVGGTWRANHYPGCACDVPTPYYSYSFGPKPDWSRFYAPHDEIRAYLEDCARRFGVLDRIRFGARATAATWDASTARWTIEVEGRAPLTCRALVAAPGGLSRPALPDVPGLEDFAGPVFHSAAWDHDVELAGARVAVVGTGASAIQFVPRISREAAHVTVFQRTAPWVLPKPDRRIGRTEQALYRRVPAAQRAVRGAVWAAQEWMGLGNTVDARLTRPLEAVGRWWIRRSIADPDLRRALTPDYAIGCKRLLLANDWYPTLARDHVDLVAGGVTRVTATGVVGPDGTEHPADVLVLGTGFRATEPLGDLPVVGRDGRTLADAWGDRLQAHRGTTIAGFPNLFVLPGPNTGTGHTSQVFMLEQQVRHTADLLDAVRPRGAAAVEPTAEAQAAFVAEVDRRSARTVWERGGCSSWYLDAQGRNVTLWPGTSLAFRRALGTVEEREFVFHPVPTPTPTPTPEEVLA